MDASYPLTGLVALGQAALFFLAGWGYGRLLVPALAASPTTRGLVALALGTGLLGYLAFALGLVGLLRPVVLLAVLAIGVLLALVGPGRSRPPPGRLTGDAPSRAAARTLLPPGLPRWSAAVLVLAGGFALLGAMLPEIEYDAMWYHLNFPLRYVRSGRLLDFPCEHMSPVPQHVELLYTYGLILEDARAAKLIHAAFGALAAVWTGVLAARLVGPRWALPAAALLVTAPTVLWEMSTAYNELPLTFLAIGAVALLIDWRRLGDRRLLLLAAALIGFGLAGKHLTAFVAAPLAIGVLLVPGAAGARPLRVRVADAVLFGVVAVAVAAPWYVRAWYYTGNPLFPMFYDLLSGLGLEITRWDQQAQADWDGAMGRYGHGRSLRDLVLLPWRMTWDGRAYAGSLGPAWLLLLPLVALVWRRLSLDLRLLGVLALAYLTLWASPYSSFQLRYLVPLVPVLSVLAVAALRHLRPLLRCAGWRRATGPVTALVVTVMVLNLPPFYLLADARSWTPSIMRSVGPAAWTTALGVRAGDSYLSRKIRPYRAVQYMNEALPPDARVVTLAGAVHFYSRVEVLHDYSRCVVAGTWLLAGDEARAYARLRDAGVTHLLWDRQRWPFFLGQPDPVPAIATEQFRSRFVRTIYEDEWTRVEELEAAGVPDGAGAGLSDSSGDPNP